MTTQKVHPRYWGRISESVGLALVIGGIVALGPLVAPILFQQLPPDYAAKAMTTIFSRFGVVLEIAMGLVVIGELIQLNFGSWTQGLFAQLRSICALFMVAMLICSVAVINPKVAAFQKQGVMRWVGAQGQELDKIHRTAEGMMKGELILGFLALLLLGLPVPHASSKPAEEK